MPERCATMHLYPRGTEIPEGPNLPSVILAVGIKTITHNRDGLKLHPHKVVAIEISCEEELASFDMTPRHARLYARRLLEYADAIDESKFEIRKVGVA